MTKKKKSNISVGLVSDIGDLLENLLADEIVPEVALKCINRIPLTRGMGSSSAALIGGLLSANSMAGLPLTTSQILNIGAKIENHPDNVAPALLGGVQIGIYDQEELITAKVSFPEDLKVLAWKVYHLVKV